MIEVDSIHKNFGDKHVLRGLSFTAKHGEITGLVGPNGAGKTTMIRILTGYYAADEGAVSICGHSMSVGAVGAKLQVGYTPENAPLYREQTVAECLRFVAHLRGVPKRLIEQEVDRAVDAFSLRKVFRQLIGTLSKGYRHRVSLAQCLLGDPPVIVLDEPTDGLDPLQKIETRKVIRELAKNKTVLLTTHLLEEVDSLCDRIVLLSEGAVAFAGTIDEVRSQGLAKSSVLFQIAGDAVEQVQAVLSGIDGVVSSEVTLAGIHTRARVVLNIENTMVDIMDLLSQRLFERGLRVIELRSEESALSTLFEK